MLLCFLFIGFYAVSNEISRFLNENGFGFLILFVFLFCCKFLPQQGEEQDKEVDGDTGEPLGYGDVDGP